VRQLARRTASAFDHAGPLRYDRDPAALAEAQIAEIRKRRGGLAVWPFGIQGLDVYPEGEALAGTWRMVPGLKPGHVTLVTGVSNSGKTTFSARVALAQAGAGRRVRYGAWEQGSGMTLELLAGMSLGIPRTRLMVGDVTELELEVMKAEMERLGEFVRFFEVPVDRARGEKKRTNAKSLDLIQEYVEAWGAGGGVVFLDLFARALVETKPEEEEQALYRLQAMAQETGAHIVIIHQQRSKDIMAREDKQPTLEGLKGSSAWFDVPDTVLGVHREYLFKAVPDDVLRLLVLKQRHGQSQLTVDFDWDANLGLVSNGRSVAGNRPGAGGGGAVDDFLNEGGGKWKKGGGGAQDKPRRKREGQR
jgi:KaiC/GvpD/RAD55 family RecA-like ATPase